MTLLRRRVTILSQTAGVTDATPDAGTGASRVITPYSGVTNGDCRLVQLSASFPSSRLTPVLTCLRVGNENLVIIGSSGRHSCPGGTPSATIDIRISNGDSEHERNVPL